VDRRLAQRALDAQVEALATLGWDEDELLELREFVTGRTPDDLADPVLRERLRMDLWWMIMARLMSAASDRPRS
jgi:hypothetical protein